MRITAVIPTFNRPLATVAAVRSVLAQTRPVDEILVVDDASQPSALAETLETLGPKVKLHRLPTNGGAAAARQAGIERASGDVVAFLDSDDLWDPGKLAAQLPLLPAEPDALCAVSCGWRELSEAKRATRLRVPVPARTALPFLSACWFCPGSTVVMWRWAIERIGPFNARLRRLEDLEWFARFGLAGGELRVAPVVGATVAIGSRARLGPVLAAAEALEQTLLPDPRMTPPERRALRAWLDIERARAALNERHVLRSASYLARSVVRYPRRSMQLADWWQLPSERND